MTELYRSILVHLAILYGWRCDSIADQPLLRLLLALTAVLLGFLWWYRPKLEGASQLPVVVGVCAGVAIVPTLGVLAAALPLAIAAIGRPTLATRVGCATVGCLAILPLVEQGAALSWLGLEHVKGVYATTLSASVSLVLLLGAGVRREVRATRLVVALAIIAASLFAGNALVYTAAVQEWHRVAQLGIFTVFCALNIVTVATVVRSTGTVGARPRLALITCGVVSVSAVLTHYGGWRSSGHIATLTSSCVVAGVLGKGSDADRPEWGKSGPFSQGMFGLLGDYCQLGGVTFSWFQDISSAVGAEPRAVVWINPSQPLSAAVAKQLTSFVDSGGSLLVALDHTNVFGSRDAVQPLLGPWGCSPRFDSAYPIGGHWGSAMCICGVARPLVTPGVTTVGWGIGASMSVTSEWEPLFVGQRAFSDNGCQENVPGAYLGNYGLDDGEALGGLVLAATRRIGKGRVVVYGDTSPLQNAALPTTALDHVLPMLRWLTSQDATLEWMMRLQRWGAALLVAGAALGRRRHALIIALGITASAVAAVGSTLSMTQVTIGSNGMVFALLKDGVPFIGHYSARYNSVGGLLMSAARSGMLPLVCNHETVKLRPAQQTIAVVIAPICALPLRTQQSLIRAVTAGGSLLLCVGYQEAARVAHILGAIGLQVNPQPLGNAPGRNHSVRECLPRFVEAYAVDRGAPGPDDTMESLATYSDRCLVAVKTLGRGLVLIVADARFFASHNMEDNDGVWPGNLALVREIVERLVPRQ